MRNWIDGPYWVFVLSDSDRRGRTTATLMLAREPEAENLLFKFSFFRLRTANFCRLRINGVFRFDISFASYRALVCVAWRTRMSKFFAKSVTGEDAKERKYYHILIARRTSVSINKFTRENIILDFCIENQGLRKYNLQYKFMKCNYEIVISLRDKTLSVYLIASHWVAETLVSLYPIVRSKWDSALIPASNAELRTDDIAIRLVTVDRMSVRPRCERVYARHASRAWFRQSRSPQLRAYATFQLSALALMKWAKSSSLCRSIGFARW